MVVEADESDGSFSKLTPTVAVVNIDSEHLDYVVHSKILKMHLINLFHLFLFMVLKFYASIISSQKLIPLNKDEDY